MKKKVPSNRLFSSIYINILRQQFTWNTQINSSGH